MHQDQNKAHENPELLEAHIELYEDTEAAVAGVDRDREDREDRSLARRALEDLRTVMSMKDFDFSVSRREVHRAVREQARLDEDRQEGRTDGRSRFGGFEFCHRSWGVCGSCAPWVLGTRRCAGGQRG